MSHYSLVKQHKSPAKKKKKYVVQHLKQKLFLMKKQTNLSLVPIFSLFGLLCFGCLLQTTWHLITNRLEPVYSYHMLHQTSKLFLKKGLFPICPGTRTTANLISLQGSKDHKSISHVTYSIQRCSVEISLCYESVSYFWSSFFLLHC